MDSVLAERNTSSIVTEKRKRILPVYLSNYVDNNYYNFIDDVGNVNIVKKLRIDDCGRHQKLSNKYVCNGDKRDEGCVKKRQLSTAVELNRTSNDKGEQQVSFVSICDTANIVQLANSLEVSPSKDKPLNVSLSATEYDKFLQYQATQQSSHGNSVACLSQTSSNTWILDSGASDHISGNPKLFSSISNPSSLSTVTIANGSTTIAKDKNRYFISADVTFFEESSFFPSTIPKSPSISEALPVPYLGPNDCISSAPLPNLLADTVDVPDNSPSVPTPSRASDLASPPILRRGTRSIRNPYPIYTFLSYHRLSSPYYAFVSSLSSISVPKSTSDALAHPGWRQAMIDEMNALHTNGTWELVSLPSGKSTVGCKWGESGMVCRLKKSLYGLKQSPRAWFGRFSEVVLSFGLQRCTVDHSVFYKHTPNGRILLIVYVDDIVITGDDNHGIQQLKSFLQSKFQTKDLGQLKYFLGIEVARSQLGICLSQRKYCLDVLSDIGMLDSKSVDTPMDPNTKLVPDEGELLTNPEQYRRLVGKLNYLTITRPDIAFATSMVSQFLSQPRTSHWNAVIRILRYLKTAPGKGLLYKNHGHTLVRGHGRGHTLVHKHNSTPVQGYSDADWAGSQFDRRSTTGYCIFLGGNLVSWKSKKQTVVARSSAESEYRAMTHTTTELVWLKNLLDELGFQHSQPMELFSKSTKKLASKKSEDGKLDKAEMSIWGIC
ncbi:Retrovirus-related Pol polyprotein from transposon TNT 1-94 [Quillaja saponaria]|uniref:Retrovirus-related Pol polyprotein from transposon TNT 1-94 n=1 Tax=Quillaja saponaria TaxID=32244 RepID=A0AAD7LT95_QUISA|nr:Retrovirus-related Pol polyprotein from transposon TNT 1-94 [Quillaja saponaria]